MRHAPLLATLLTVALVAPGWPGPAARSPALRLAASSTTGTVTTADLAPEADLVALQHDLDAATRSATEAAAAAREDAGRAVQAQIVRQQALLGVDRARRALRTDVRRALADGPLETAPGWVFAPDPSTSGLLPLMRERQIRRRGAEITAVRDALTTLDAATRTLAAQRNETTRRAGDAVLAADTARRLLDRARRVHADNIAIRARLDAQRRALDELNRRLLAAVTPVQSIPDPYAGASNPPGSTPSVDTFSDGTRPDASAATQAAVLKVLESNPPDALPPGFRPTGQVIEGQASWYGPGFIGSPTSSGVPYDPERLTCAMLKVPLGAVVRVTTADGASVNLLVNDHGPYVGDRVLDVSMRANRILGLGLGQVRIEVLQHTG